MTHDNKIEKYIRGEFSPEERADFEKELASDDNLARELAAYRKSELVIKAGARNQIREAAQGAYDSFHSKQKRRAAWTRRAAIAAGFFLLLAMGIWWLSDPAGPSTPNELYAQYFEMPPPPGLRNGSSEVNPKWQEALLLYSKTDFRNAIPLFREILTDPSFEQKESARLLVGASLIATENASDAITMLERIRPESSVYEDAEWYLALAFLKANQPESAKKAFEVIAGKDRHYKKKEAARILANW